MTKTPRKKADILNLIKDAEERTERLKKEAAEESERNIAKAKTDSMAKVEEGKTEARARYDAVVEKAFEDLKRQREVLTAKEKRYLEEFKIKASGSVEKAANHLMSEFERAANV